MNTNSITTLTLAGLLVALSACEGEPPKAPTNPPASPIAETTATDTAAPPNAAATAPAGVATGATAASNGMHAGMEMPCAAGAAPENAAAPAGPAATSTPAAPPAIAGAAAPATSTHSIVGTVSTVPARAAATAVVYLEDAGVVPTKSSYAGVDNHGMSFIPYITVVPVGGRVVFSNSDPFPHNVFSPDNERFNLGTVQMKGSSAHTFKTAGVYSLLCNLHPNMLGYVVVSPSSYFAKTNGKGQFAIKDVPPGTYKITAWAPRLPPVTQAVTVNDDVTSDFALHR